MTMTQRTVLHGVIACMILLLLSATAQAQLFRSYLSQTGSDANSCTLQAPCRLLPAALSAVANGGEVWMLDSANYNTGPVNITKSVTILAIPGALGSVVGNGGDAIDINTAGVNVSLRNLKILNLGGGLIGINMINGSSLTVEGCVITGFNGSTAAAGIFVGSGISFIAATIVDSVIRNNYNGIWFDSGASGNVARTTVVENTYVGIYAHPSSSDSTVTVMVSDTVSSSNTYGILATTFPTAVAKVTITRAIASNNATSGIEADAPFTTFVVSESTASGNAVYGFRNSGATFYSLGDNVVRNNAADINGTISVVAHN
jgi:Right handed beta helix region